jgi:2'-5' RNA ligase
MPKKLEDCVANVKKQMLEKGQDPKKASSSAYAICSKATGWKKAGKHKWRKGSKTVVTENVITKIQTLIEEVFSGKEKGIYIEAKPDGMTLQKIWGHLKATGLPVMPAQNAHVTIIYSTRAPSSPIKIKDSQITAKIKGFRIFSQGTPNNPYVLVLELDSPDLRKLHQYYMREYNLKYSYPEYIPHMTITYDLGRIFPGLKKMSSKQKKTIEQIFNKLIPELPQKIKFTKQVLSPLNED